VIVGSSPNMKKLFLIISIFFFSFVVSRTLFASTIDDFDTYNTGSVIGQGNWQAGTDPAYPQVITNNFSSPNGLSSYSFTNQSTAYKTLSITNPEYFGFVFKVTAKTQTGSDLILYSDSQKTLINIYFQFQTTGDSLTLRTIDSTYSTNFFASSTYGVWHSVMFKFSSNRLSYSVSIDGGDYSGAYSSHNVGVNFAYINNVQLRYGYSSVLLPNTLIIDDILLNETSFINDPDTVEIIDPNYEQYSSIFVSDEYFNYSKKIYCNYTATSSCYLTFNYPFTDVNKSVKLINEDSSEEVGTTTLEQTTAMRYSFVIPNPESTMVQNYCLYLLNGIKAEKSYCDIEVYWSSMNIDEALGIEPYDISKACEEVEPSDESLWENFRYGIECGFNKSMYWLLHPQTQTTVDLIMSFDKLTDEFPINVFKNVDRTLKSASSSVAVFTVPLYLGELSNNGTTSVEVFNIESLGDTFGNIWTTIYQYLEILVYAVTIIYFINWFIGKKSDSEIE